MSMSKKDTKAKIDPQRWYTMQDICREGLIPFAKSVWSVRIILNADHAKGKRSVLRPIINGEGAGKKYLVKGERITKFIRLVEAGTVTP